MSLSRTMYPFSSSYPFSVITMKVERLVLLSSFTLQKYVNLRQAIIRRVIHHILAFLHVFDERDCEFSVIPFLFVVLG